MDKNSGPNEEARELELLEVIEEDPAVRQVDIATRLGVAVGTVNWLLKRLAGKGYIRMKRIGRWQWRYLLTPSGIARKAKLTRQYVRASMTQYRKTRTQVLSLIEEVKETGWSEVRLIGDPTNDLVDVCRLTCVEQELKLAKETKSRDHVPAFRVVGRDVRLELPETAAKDGDG